MHLASRQLPHVALAFEEFLCNEGQAEIQRQLGTMPVSPKVKAKVKAKAKAAKAKPTGRTSPAR